MTDEQRAREWLEASGWAYARSDTDLLAALLARRALEARKEALEEAAQTFEREYIKHEGVMGSIRGLAAIRSLAAASKAAAKERP